MGEILLRTTHFISISYVKEVEGFFVTFHLDAEEQMVLFSHLSLFLILFSPLNSVNRSLVQQSTNLTGILSIVTAFSDSN